MGVRIGGVWHEELADPGTGGSDEGGGRNFDSAAQYNRASDQLTAANAWGENLNTRAGEGSPTVGLPDPNAALNAVGSSQQLGGQIDALLKAIAEGNAKAFTEAVRQFDLTHGLDVQKFQDTVRQFNENLAIAQGGVTGVYQGAPTLAARLQQANLYGTETPGAGAETLASQLQRAQQLGTYQGQQTLAAQNQYFGQGLNAINAAAALQANPFRQAEVMGQVGALLGGRPVAGFQAPTATNQTDFSGLGNMQRMIDDIRAGSTGSNSVNPESVLAAIPTPNKVDSRAFMNMAPEQQSLILSGIQQKYGLSPENATAQIKATLPAFAAPSTWGRVVR